MYIQPVVPIGLSADWDMISRTILPVIDQDNVATSGSKSGIGDITQSLFFSPKKPGASGWIWGVGPVGSAAGRDLAVPSQVEGFD